MGFLLCSCTYLLQDHKFILDSCVLVDLLFVSAGLKWRVGLGLCKSYFIFSGPAAFCVCVCVCECTVFYLGLFALPVTFSHGELRLNVSHIKLNLGLTCKIISAKRPPFLV